MLRVSNGFPARSGATRAAKQHPSGRLRRCPSGSAYSLNRARRFSTKRACRKTAALGFPPPAGVAPSIGTLPLRGEAGGCPRWWCCEGRRCRGVGLESAAEDNSLNCLGLARPLRALRARLRRGFPRFARRISPRFSGSIKRRLGSLRVAKRQSARHFDRLARLRSRTAIWDNSRQEELRKETRCVDPNPHRREPLQAAREEGRGDPKRLKSDGRKPKWGSFKENGARRKKLAEM